MRTFKIFEYIMIIFLHLFEVGKIELTINIKYLRYQLSTWYAGNADAFILVKFDIVEAGVMRQIHK